MNFALKSEISNLIGSSLTCSLAATCSMQQTGHSVTQVKITVTLLEATEDKFYTNDPIPKHDHTLIHYDSSLSEMLSKPTWRHPFQLTALWRGSITIYPPVAYSLFRTGTTYSVRHSSHYYHLLLLPFTCYDKTFVCSHLLNKVFVQ